MFVSSHRRPIVANAGHIFRAKYFFQLAFLLLLPLETLFLLTGGRNNNERDKRATRTDSRPAKRTIKFCFVTNMEKGPFVNVALT